MHCVKCGSDRLREFSTEIAIHFSAREIPTNRTFLYAQKLWCAWIAGFRSSASRNLN